MGLGRGFDSLIPSELLDESFDPTAEQDEQVSDLRHIVIDEIIADPDQPRRTFEEESLLELSESIKTHGILQPIVVTPRDGRYMIVAGERRYRAALMAGLKKIPALVRTLSDQHKLELSLIENLQRRDLNPLETATAYLKLRDQFNLTLDQIGARVGGKSMAAVSNTLRLLRLPVIVRDAIAAGALTEGQARPLVNLDPSIIEQILPRMLTEGWTSRAVEQYVARLRAHGTPERELDDHLMPPSYKTAVRHLESRFAAPVQVKTSRTGTGTIVIRFKDTDDFKRITKLLG